MSETSWLAFLHVYLHFSGLVKCGPEQRPQAEQKDQLPVVVVTGFGPFGEHKVNASWEVVKLLPSKEFEDELGVKLVIKEIPVVYEDVIQDIPALWETYSPLLVVHVGVSSIASALTLEMQAHKQGYCRPDVNGKLPPNCEHPRQKSEVLQPLFDVEVVCKKANGCTSVPICKSNDAGRYLCEFIYYTSLSIDCLRTMFVHVPTLDVPYSAAEMAAGLKNIISILVQEIKASSEDSQKCKCAINI